MYFDRDDVSLPHFSRFFLDRSKKEQEQAEKLLDYQNRRGGRVLLQNIAVRLECPYSNVNTGIVNLNVNYCFSLLLLQKPSREDWKGGLDAMTFSLDYQKSLNTCILDVHRRADNHKDPHVSLDF